MLNSERLVPTKKTEPFYLEHIQRYKFALPYVKGKKVLDLGCGVGYGSYYLARQGAKVVVGVDIDPKAIAFAKKKYRLSNVQYQTSDAQKLSFKNNSFDCVVSFEVIEHIALYKRYLEEIKRVLKKNGCFILSTPNKFGHRGSTSAYHTKEFSKAELSSELRKAGFKANFFGQFFEDIDFVNSETQYFRRYNLFTLGGNKTIKKLLNYASPYLKSKIYTTFWKPITKIGKNKITIKSNNINRSTTLIAVCKNAKIHK